MITRWPMWALLGRPAILAMTIYIAVPIATNDTYSFRAFALCSLREGHPGSN
jgi:hypothetical protein